MVNLVYNLIFVIMPLLSRSVVYHDFVPLSQRAMSEEVLSQCPILIDGADVYDILCPPSSLTGNRNNPLDLLRMVLPDKENRFLNQILQEIPTVSSDPNLSDEDRISTLTYRLASGTPAEDEIVMHSLMKVADVLFPHSSSDDNLTDKIGFSPSDVDNSSE